MENEVAAIFSQALHIEVPSYDSDLFEAGILDSLQLVELLFQLERQFQVRISLDEIELDSFRSIERIAVMLVRQNGYALPDDPSRIRPRQAASGGR